LGFPITRKNLKRNAQGVIQKDPTNVINAQNTGARVEENVFFNLDIYPTITYM